MRRRRREGVGVGAGGEGAGARALLALAVCPMDSWTSCLPGPLAISPITVSESFLPLMERWVRAVRAFRTDLKELALMSCGREGVRRAVVREGWVDRAE